MRKFTMFFMSSLICMCGCFTACSGNSDDNGEELDNGEVLAVYYMSDKEHDNCFIEGAFFRP